MAEKTPAELRAETIKGIESRGKKVWTRKKKASASKAGVPGPVAGGTVRK